MTRHQTRSNEDMTPANDDFSNRELSIEQLEAIAAGVSLLGPGPIISPPPPHWVFLHAPSPIWAEGSASLTISHKLF
jgi:hypothetical protein